MILLVGATGRLGKAVAERLLQHGLPFRAACRDVEKARWLVERGVEVLPLDVESGAGLAQAMTGVTKVISSIHGLMGKSRRSIERVDVRGQAALIDAAAEAGVGRFVYISALGASPDHPSEFWRAKARTEQHLKASGLDYVILRPSAFMDLYAHDLIGAAVMRGKTVFLLGRGITPRNMVAVADVADAAVEALSRDDLARRTIEIGGPDEPTEREVAALYAGLSGKPLRLRSLPPLLLKTLAAAIGPFHAGAGHLLRLPLQLAGRQDLLLDPSSPMDRLVANPVRLRDYAEARLRAEGALVP
ncbi:MAG TPA: NAD(P)H-binding protein [Allosphingosinicella sp.]|jgi:NADH dehydrogenase